MAALLDGEEPGRHALVPPAPAQDDPGPNDQGHGRLHHYPRRGGGGPGPAPQVRCRRFSAGPGQPPVSEQQPDGGHAGRQLRRLHDGERHAQPAGEPAQAGGTAAYSERRCSAGLQPGLQRQPYVLCDWQRWWPARSPSGRDAAGRAHGRAVRNSGEPDRQHRRLIPVSESVQLHCRAAGHSARHPNGQCGLWLARPGRPPLHAQRQQRPAQRRPAEQRGLQRAQD